MAAGFQPSAWKAADIRRLAWERCGIVRCGDGLRQAIEQLEHDRPEPRQFSPEAAEARNVRQVALLIARCALAREESRGAHFRTDFPIKRAEFEKHSVIGKDVGIRFA